MTERPAGLEERHAEAARALLSQGQFSAGARLLRLAVQQGAGAWAWQLLGTAEHALGRLPEALEALNRAVEMSGGSVDALCARATVFFALDDLAASEQDLARALQAAPSHVDAHCNLGVLRERQGRQAEAIEAYDRALTIDPESYVARLNRAALRLDAGNAVGALEDLERLAAGPQCTAAVHLGRAKAFFALYRDADALAAADAAVRLDPSSAQAWLDRAMALASLGHFRDAQLALERAGAAANPRLAPLAMRISRLLLRQSVCDWSERELLGSMLRRCASDAAVASALEESGLLFSAMTLPLSGADLLAVGRAALVPARRMAAGLRVMGDLRDGTSPGRIRVGFFAASLRVHPESFLIRRQFKDRDSARFEYFLYALNPDDGSPLRSELAQSADRFLDVSTWTSAAIVQRARADGLDLAVDLSGAYSHARPEIFAARVAPVQAAHLALPASMGGVHDYRISDEWTTPASEQGNWDERLALLSTPPFAYDDSIQAAGAGTRADHGLPSQGVVFACMNQAIKLEPESFDVWMRLLRGTPGSVLWLLDHGGVANANLLQEAASRGVPPERLVFAQRRSLAEHLGRLAQADLFLDTFSCNAHTTALDALWAGVPVLTLAGRTMAARLASSFVRALGMPDLAVGTVGEYEAAALAIASDSSKAKALKEEVRLKARVSPLFDTRARVASVERAFLAMVERHRSGLAPAILRLE